jgi:peptidoglycan hydrolase CwlO-like protein
MKQQEDYADVIEENKELRRKVEELDKQVKTLIFERDMRLAEMRELEEENDKLREEIDYLNAHN